jgi:hypothetical protein
MDDTPQGYRILVEWDAVSPNTPLLVNQIQLGMGPDSSYGSDGIHYLRFGHVTPPMGPPEDEDMVLRVQEVGHFALTYDRLLELRDLLNRVTGYSGQVPNEAE